MRMSNKLVKSGTRGLDSLKDNYTAEENAEALRELRAGPEYTPLNGMVGDRFAGQAKQFLDKGYTELSDIRRSYASRIVEHLVNGTHWEQSHASMSKKLGISRNIIRVIERQWPYMYHFVNLLILELIVPVSFGRVLHATADAAVHGTDRDRRLYYELFAGLKQKDKGSGGVNVIFVNDAMKRPEAEVIEITAEEQDE